MTASGLAGCAAGEAAGRHEEGGASRHDSCIDIGRVNEGHVMLGLFSGSRKWVYAQDVFGRFQRVHRWSGRALMAFLVGVPWLRIDGHQAVLIDVPHRRMTMFKWIFTASDGFLIVLLGLLAAFSLFFFTSLFGRLWCGYVCPQTVFLEELVRPIERLIEGPHTTRMKRDATGFGADRVARKVAKWAVFAALAVAVSMSFMGWFAGARELWTGAASGGNYAIVGFFSTIWFLDWAWFREQLCNYVCPYARFQGALADDESLVVTYDVSRGEPRARGKANGLAGHCVDCGKCVAVCPQGIDIRNGYQLECITCARCVDACTEVMGRFDQPSLVSYGTVAETEGRKPRLLRPRTVGYASLLAVITLAIGVLVWRHESLEAQVARTPGSTWTVDADGWIRNTYLVHVTNRDEDDKPETFHVSVEGLPGAEVIVDDVTLGSTESRAVPLVVRIPPKSVLPRSIPVTVHVRSDDGEVRRPATFLTPGGVPSGT